MKGYATLRSTMPLLGIVALIALVGLTGCATAGKGGYDPPPPPPPTAQPPSDPAPPTRPSPGTVDPEVTAQLRTVHFDFDKSAVRSDAASNLRHNAQVIKDNPQVDIRIEGHCDERGSDQYNQALGERRALSVKRFLTGEGIDGNRLGTISYGESRPVVPNARNEADHQKNRRAEFIAINVR